MVHITHEEDGSVIWESPEELGHQHHIDHGDLIYDNQIRASYYLSFVSWTLLAGGLAFLMPIFVLGLVRLRVLTSSQLRGNRSTAFVVLLVFAILLPTVDPVSLAFEVIPLVLLFELSIWLSVFLERRWARSWTDDLAADV